MDSVSPYTKVLCGDCLCVRDYTDARHEGDEPCVCGGEFCGCEYCTDTINALQAGKRKAREIGCKHDIGHWTAAEGTRAAETTVSQETTPTKEPTA